MLQSCGRNYPSVANSSSHTFDGYFRAGGRYRQKLSYESFNRYGGNSRSGLHLPEEAIHEANAHEYARSER